MTNSTSNWLENRVADGNASRQMSQTDPFTTQQTMPMTQQTMPMAQQPFLMTQQGPPPSTEPGYIPAFLVSNIGRNIRAEFVIGNAYLDKAGRLIEVGINYFVLEEQATRTRVMCDLYSVKFVDVLP